MYPRVGIGVQADKGLERMYVEIFVGHGGGRSDSSPQDANLSRGNDGFRP